MPNASMSEITECSITVYQFLFIVDHRNVEMYRESEWASEASGITRFSKVRKMTNLYCLIPVVGYPPIRFAHSGENQVLRKSKRYASRGFFFGGK